MIVPFEMQRFEILKLSVEANDKFDKGGGTKAAVLKVQMMLSAHEKDPRRWRLTLALDVDSEKPEEMKLLPYRIKIVGRGYFAFKDDASKDDAEHTLRLNGASILYGLLRAQVLNVTALSNNEAYLLDTMNFVQAEKDHLKELAESKGAPSAGNKEVAAQ